MFANLAWPTTGTKDAAMFIGSIKPVARDSKKKKLLANLPYGPLAIIFDLSSSNFFLSTK